MHLSVFDLAGHFIPTIDFRLFSYETGEVYDTIPVFEICKLPSVYRDIMVMDWALRPDYVEVMF